MRFRIRAGRAVRALAAVGALTLAALGIGAPAAYAGLDGWPMGLIDQQCGPTTGGPLGLTVPTDHITFVMGKAAPGLYDPTSATVTWAIAGTSRTGTATATFDADRQSATLLFNPVLTPAGSTLNVTFTFKYAGGQYTRPVESTPLLACNSSADYGKSAADGPNMRVTGSITQSCSSTSSGTQDYVIVRTAPGIYNTADDLAGEPVWDDYWFDGATSITSGVYGYSDASGRTSLVFRIASPPTGRTLNVQTIVRDQYGNNWPMHLAALVVC
ncbi:hypothetical protein [Streptomyces sp. NPDC048277]|uniref:hypothetical protein n=1 Tax=Streptomyces sp. NPDC048277 TaxID=3155027 RepID=UPI0033C97B4A